MLQPAGKKPRHVIILGAGASASSGYPVANKLRLLMSSEETLREGLSKRIKLNTAQPQEIVEKVMGGKMKGTIELFRHGGFATVDEFSYLARGRFPDAVQDLKRLLRFALALDDPEERFHESDYYVFIQKLFQKGLFPLRDDIAILTFNYDPYLPYLLSKAYKVRCNSVGKETNANALDAITSGFSTRSVGALEDGDDLCVLQLHGSIAWPRVSPAEGAIWYHHLFGTSVGDRMNKLCLEASSQTRPPIVFPWEVLDDEGKFLPEEASCLSEVAQGEETGYSGSTSLHQLFISIWKRARKEINRATKISFVGLSMHEFLNPAFKFLFTERKDDAIIVCANKEHEKFQNEGLGRLSKIMDSPLSPTCKLRRLLTQVCPAIKGKHTTVNGTPWPGQPPTIQVRETFRDFIESEMD
jgi:hypothetical protein